MTPRLGSFRRNAELIDELTQVAVQYAAAVVDLHRPEPPVADQFKDFPTG